MVTAEIAVAMPALLAVLALAVSGIGAGVVQLRVTDAARVAARAAAAGQADPLAVARRAGGAMDISLQRGELTCAYTSAPAPGVLGTLGVRARSRACAWTEPSTP